MANKHEPCADIQLAENEIEHINKNVEKLEAHEVEQDKEIQNLKNELTEVKTVNAFLAQQVKDIINVKNKINSSIVKYFFYLVGIIFLISIVTNYEKLSSLIKFFH